MFEGSVSNPPTGQPGHFRVGMYDILPFGMFLNSTKTVAYPTRDTTTFAVEMFPGTIFQVAFKKFANSSEYYRYDSNTFIVDLETDQYGLVTMTIYDDSGLQDNVAFVNEYVPEPATCLVDFTKELSGFPGDACPAFEFTMKAAEDYKMQL